MNSYKKDDNGSKVQKYLNANAEVVDSIDEDDDDDGQFDFESVIFSNKINTGSKKNVHIYSTEEKKKYAVECATQVMLAIQKQQYNFNDAFVVISQNKSVRQQVKKLKTDIKIFKKGNESLERNLYDYIKMPRQEFLQRKNEFNISTDRTLLYRGERRDFIYSSNLEYAYIRKTADEYEESDYTYDTRELVPSIEEYNEDRQYVADRIAEYIDNAIKTSESSDNAAKAMNRCVFYVCAVLAAISLEVPIYDMYLWQLVFIKTILDNIASIIGGSNEDMKHNVGMYCIRLEDAIIYHGIIADLPTGTGKTFFGYICSMMSIMGDPTKEMGVGKVQQTKALWGTYSKTLVQQCYRTFLIAISTRAFGIIYNRKTAIDSAKLIALGVGSSAPNPVNAFFIICTYEHASMFCASLLDKRAPKSTETDLRLFTIRGVIVDEVHYILDSSRGKIVDNILWTASKYGIPMYVMSGTLTESLEEELIKEYDFSIISSQSIQRPKRTEISFIKIDKEIKSNSDAKNVKEKVSPTQDLILKFAYIVGYTKWITDRDAATRSIVYINSNERLEQSYACMVGIVYGAYEPYIDIAKIALTTDRKPQVLIFRHNQEVDIVKTFLRSYKEISGHDFPLASSVKDPFSVMVLGQSVGVVMDNTPMYQDDVVTRDKFQGIYSRSIIEERGISLEDHKDLGMPPFRMLLATSIISTGVNIQGASTLVIDNRSFSIMDYESYYQILGRVGRYEDSKVYIFDVNIQDERQIVKRQQKIQRTLADNELYDRIVTLKQTIDISDEKKEAVEKHISKMGGRGNEVGLKGYYQPVTSVTLKALYGDIENIDVDNIDVFGNTSSLSHIISVSLNVVGSERINNELTNLLTGYFNSFDVFSALRDILVNDESDRVLVIVPYFLPFSYYIQTKLRNKPLRDEYSPRESKYIEYFPSSRFPDMFVKELENSVRTSNFLESSNTSKISASINISVDIIYSIFVDPSVISERYSVSILDIAQQLVNYLKMCKSYIVSKWQSVKGFRALAGYIDNITKSIIFTLHSVSAQLSSVYRRISNEVVTDNLFNGFIVQYQWADIDRNTDIDTLNYYKAIPVPVYETNRGTSLVKKVFYNIPKELYAILKRLEMVK